MITVEEALETVLAAARPLAARSCPLAEALGLILAEPIDSDLDLPPFDKALMDGYAVRASEFSEHGDSRFREGERITAGETPSRPLKPGEAAIIMTGAPLPEGADCVVPHERTSRTEDGIVTIPEPHRVGSAVLKRAREMAAGERLFEPGTTLDAIRIGVLAGVGKDPVHVIPRPRVVIVPTGDELVPTTRKPGPGQIRETNSAILQALARPFGPAIARPIAADHLAGLRQSLGEALDETPDVLIVCGGVSAGQKDLVPEVLASLDFESVFHKVKLKPGKPLLFARPNSTKREGGPLVFGLPGNPVSGIVGFLLFVRPVLRAMLGYTESDDREEVELAGSFHQRGDRPTYHPATLRRSGGSLPRATALNWAGSADLMTVARSDGFLALPAGDRHFAAGETVPFLALPR